jgi:hypothetical protein
MSHILSALSAHYIEPFYAVALPEANAESLCCLLIILCPYLFYFWLWHWPSPFGRFSESLGFHPSILMSYFAHAMKLALFSLLFFYPNSSAVPSFLGDCVNSLLASLPLGLRVDTYDLELNWLTVLDLVLGGVGQALNSGVYASLGTVGTYYGNRFGDPPAWATGFPYNIGISDPQYWGSILTVVSTLNLLQTRRNPFFQLILLLSYFFMMGVEAKERSPPYKLKSKSKSKQRKE